MLGKERAEGLRRVEAALRAQILEPAWPDRNMVYFLTQNDLEDGDGLDITDLAQAHHHARRHIKSTRLEHSRHQRHSQQHVVRGAFGRFPQTVVGGEITVVVAESLTSRTQHREMPGPVRAAEERRAGNGW